VLLRGSCFSAVTTESIPFWLSKKILPSPAMGEAYATLLADRTALLGQLQAHAAAVNDPAVREAVRRGFANLYEFVARASLASDEEIQAWFAKGMLLNVLAAMDAESVDAPWARALLGG